MSNEITLESKPYCDESGKFLWDDYGVYLLNPLARHNPDSFSWFERTFFKTQSKLFSQPETENGVLEDYRTCPNRLDIPKGRSIVRMGEDYYCVMPRGCFSNLEGNKKISVTSVDRIDLEYYNPFAVKYLLMVLNEEELDLPDKRLVRDIALESFHSALQLAASSHGPRWNLLDCLATSENEHALESLREYGFRVNAERFLEVDSRTR